MAKRFLAVGTLFAALSIMLGAFAAHGLKQYLASGQMTQQQLLDFQTGARYQMYHALALILTGILIKQYSFSRLANAAGWLFITGIIFFSGSLYLLAMRDVFGMTSWMWLGPITPLGGLCFITAWILLTIAILICKGMNPGTDEQSTEH